MLRNKNTNEKGFTIIEVVITIAIGAAVMALVLNAVQGARRSQRNVNRAADVSAVTAAVNQYIANRNALPTARTDIDSFLSELAHYPATNIEIGSMSGTLGSYNLAGVTYAAATHTPANGGRILVVANDADADNIVILGDAGCLVDDIAAIAGNQTDDLLEDGGLRQMVITYRIEADANIYCEEI